MQRTLVITSPNVERLKQQARNIKKEKNIPHTQALDEVAREAGFNHWHHVTQSHELIRPAEEAFISGCVLVFDVKEGMDVGTSDGVIIEDHLLQVFCNKPLFELYINSPDEDDELNRPLRETQDIEELRQWFEEEDYMFFRLDDKAAKQPLKKILKLIREYSFWMPYYMWLDGKMIDTYHIPSEDDEGNIVGVRL